MVQVVAVKITNNTGRVLDGSQDLKFYVGQQQVMPMAPEIVHNLIKQSTPSHLLYLLLLPVKFTSSTSVNGVETESKSFPIGLILGPALTGINMAVASSSNKKMLQDLRVNAKESPRPWGFSQGMNLVFFLNHSMRCSIPSLLLGSILPYVLPPALAGCYLCCSKHALHRDVNAASNIRNKAVGQTVSAWEIYNRSSQVAQESNLL
ncbi:hypothetical protein POKO110462_13615 [Pontibacter korlensis]|uniref:Uncharacterized protein n=1 Tax=Pontibacter korlensis TaxID=400092 RepID=A0A0E3ZIB9_9BACT|nr:hypothetical protein [Pontibacter korlensis]AKD05299.1 hypothetical protein PKOR_22330 [Pontibacter korlensis]